jgi:hypothetical protein
VKAQQIELDAEYDEFCHPSIILAERVTEYLLMSHLRVILSYELF